MPDDASSAAAVPISARFPDLKVLEEQVERAKLHQTLATTQSSAARANLPSFDASPTSDTITEGNQVIGLAPVVTTKAAIPIADSIASGVLNALYKRTAASNDGKRRYRVCVTSDASTLNSLDALRLLRLELAALRQRLSASLSDGPADDVVVFNGDDSQPLDIAKDAASVLQAAGVQRNIVGAGLPLVGAVATGLIQAVAFATKLLQKSYTVTGAQVDVTGFGLDFMVSSELQRKQRSDEKLDVRALRLNRLPEAGIIEEVLSLAAEVDGKLRPAIELVATQAAAAAASADAAREASTTLAASILELTKQVGGTNDNASGRKEVLELRDREIEAKRLVDANVDRLSGHKARAQARLESLLQMNAAFENVSY